MSEKRPLRDYEMDDLEIAASNAALDETLGTRLSDEELKRMIKSIREPLPHQQSIIKRMVERAGSKERIKEFFEKRRPKK